MSMSPAPSTVVAELEGGILRDPDPFPYFMLLAFEIFGLPRFTLLLLLWPLLQLLRAAGRPDLALRVMTFVALAGAPMAQVELVCRAVLPKFLIDDVDIAAWGKFSARRRRAVVTAWPSVLAERFAREHLGAEAVVGSELEVTKSGRVTGLIRREDKSPEHRLRSVLFLNAGADTLDLAIGSRVAPSLELLSLCKEQIYPPFVADADGGDFRQPPLPVIFHDGRLVRRPTALMSLIILLWLPLGAIVAFIRIAVGLIVPVGIIPHIAPIFGGAVIIHGQPPPPVTTDKSNSGVLFVCTHRTLMDPVALATVLGRRVTAVTYSISRLSEILSPIPTVRLTRDRQVDAARIKEELSKGDLAVCPEGTTCREPFLLRFSALFAELTDRIVPVAMNCRAGFFHPTTARGWKAMDPIFFFMNPRPVYEITFLSQLPEDATCASGKSAVDVANYVQRLLAATLGFECTNFTRKDKYQVLAGNDGVVGVKPAAAPRLLGRVKDILGNLLLRAVDR